MKNRIETIGDCTLYLGDCREILPTLGRVDAVVTDPPYGINFEYATYKDSPEQWTALMDAVVPLCRDISNFVIMPCCTFRSLPWWYQNHTPDWIVAWYKGSPGHQSAIGFNSWEPHLAWGRPSTPMHDYFSTNCGFEKVDHPCPKPLPYSLWLVSRAAKYDETVVDPFMGSGTTGVACVKLGRKFIGIEIEPRYFDIACRRIDEATRQGDIFIERPSKPKQEALI